MKKIFYSCLFVISIWSFMLISPTNVNGQDTTDGDRNSCFSSDPGMGSTNRDDHYNWAQGKDPYQLEINLKLKINTLYGCPSVTDDDFAATFADFSVVIAKYIQNAGCFNNDAGAISTDRSAHYRWAKTKSRRELLQNLQWKITAAFKCLNNVGKKNLFADASVPIAKKSPTNDLEVLVKNTDCSGFPGSYAAVNPQTNKIDCFCNPGLVWNSTKTACIEPTQEDNSGKWVGTWVLRADPTMVFTINNDGSGIHTMINWLGKRHMDKSQFSGCVKTSLSKYKGNAIQCTWTGQYEDEEKSLTCRGTVIFTLRDENTMSANVSEGPAANIKWKSKFTYDLTYEYGGREWDFTLKRK